jgi:hypothetical protein
MDIKTTDLLQIPRNTIIYKYRCCFCGKYINNSIEEIWIEISLLLIEGIHAYLHNICKEHYLYYVKNTQSTLMSRKIISERAKHNEYSTMR